MGRFLFISLLFQTSFILFQWNSNKAKRFDFIFSRFTRCSTTANWFSSVSSKMIISLDLMRRKLFQFYFWPWFSYDLRYNFPLSLFFAFVLMSLNHNKQRKEKLSQKTKKEKPSQPTENDANENNWVWVCVWTLTGDMTFNQKNGCMEHINWLQLKS